eukprot:8262194-Karenia_brevis.AAC.1
MEENVVEEIQMDLPPSPIGTGEEEVGPPWPSMGDESFLEFYQAREIQVWVRDQAQLGFNMIATW